jgi:predicted membrane protein
MPENRFQPTGRLVFGLVVITLGVLFMLDNLNIMEADVVLRWWPVALLAYGLMRLTGTLGRQNVTGGLILTLIGGWFLLRTLGAFRLDVIFTDFWPIVLVVVGGSMVAGAMRRARAPGGGADPSNRVSAFAFWSGVDRKVVTPDFQGGDLTAFMGGHDVDLRSAKMTEGSAVIDLLVMMGGVDLRIPEDWALSCEAVPIMGSVEDHTRPPAGEVRGRLILRGLVMMGGVEVKN